VASGIAILQAHREEEHTKRQLTAELRMSQQECESLMRLVDSQLEVTVSFLAEPERSD